MTGQTVFCLTLLVSVIALLMSGFPVVFVLAGASLAVAALAAAFGLFDLALLTAFPQRVFATMSSEIWIAVPLFVFMGVALQKSKTAEDLLQAVGRLFAGRRGGLGFAVCLVGMLMAASTGIVGATVVTMGLLALPVMLRSGYDPALSCGTIAAAGTLGQIIPPSIVLVLLGDQLSIAYQTAQYDRGVFAPETVTVNELFAGALVPGLLLVALYLAYQAVYAWRRPDGVPAAVQLADGQDDAPPLWRSLFAPVFLILAVLGSILFGVAPTVEASSIGAVGALMIAGARAASKAARLIAAGLGAWLAVFVLAIVAERFGFAATVVTWLSLVLVALGSAGLAAAVVVLVRAREDTGSDVSLLSDMVRTTLSITAMIFAIVLGASLFALVLRGLGGDGLIETALERLPGGAFGAVFAVMAVMFVLGFFLDFLEIVFIVVPVVAPVLLQMSAGGDAVIDPVWLGVMMALVLQTSFLTPPFGFALFYLRGVAPEEVRTADIYRGAAPFVLLQLGALAIVWFVPHLAMALPQTLYGL